MSNIMAKRIQKEVSDVIKSDECAQSGIKIKPIGDNNKKLEGEFKGPPETPFENGTFKLSIEIPDNYPFKPPQVKFVNKLWHPNVSSVTGVICLDILKDKWTSSMSLRTVLLSIQALLSDAQPNDPQDAVVAKQYMDNTELYKKTAKYWSQFYAGAPGELDEDLKKRVIEVTQFCKDPVSEKALVALSNNGWEVIKAKQRI